MIQLSCPACRKLNESPTDPARFSCSRCGCELSSLCLILQAATWHLAAGVRNLKQRDHHAALQHGEISWSLRHSRRAACLAALAAAALGDIDSLKRWRSHASAAV